MFIENSQNPFTIPRGRSKRKLIWIVIPICIFLLNCLSVIEYEWFWSDSVGKSAITEKRTMLIVAAVPHSLRHVVALWSQLQCIQNFAKMKVIISSPIWAEKIIVPIIEEAKEVLEVDIKAEFHVNDRYDVGLWCDALKFVDFSVASKFENVILINDSVFAISDLSKVLKQLVQNQTRSMTSLSYSEKGGYWVESVARGFNLRGLETFVNYSCSVPASSTKFCPRLSSRARRKRCLVDYFEIGLSKVYKQEEIGALFRSDPPISMENQDTWVQNEKYWKILVEEQGFPVAKVSFKEMIRGDINAHPMLHKCTSKMPTEVVYIWKDFSNNTEEALWSDLISDESESQNLDFEDKAPRCVWTFERYEPSDWEAEWFHQIVVSGQFVDNECERLAEQPHLNNSLHLIRRIPELLYLRVPELEGSGIRPQKLPVTRAYAPGDEIFSRLIYSRYCIGSDGEEGEVRPDHVFAVQLIDPLQGINRDPTTMCGSLMPRYTTLPMENLLQSKRHLLPGVAAPVCLFRADGLDSALEKSKKVCGAQSEGWAVSPKQALALSSAYHDDVADSKSPLLTHSQFLRNQRLICASQIAQARELFQNQSSGLDIPRPDLGDTCGSRNILLDLGASTYNLQDGDGDSAYGAAWFVDRYSRLGVDFDLILSFEAIPKHRDGIWRGVPESLVHRYLFVNQPASANLSSPFHPFNYARNFARATDYVVVKLDVDNSKVENAIMAQILAKVNNWHTLVDEIFYEHHTRTKAMRNKWAATVTRDSPLMRDTYTMFTDLRKMGIRAHSWP